jgi:hypothetical protein
MKFAVTKLISFLFLAHPFAAQADSKLLSCKSNEARSNYTLTMTFGARTTAALYKNNRLQQSFQVLGFMDDTDLIASLVNRDTRENAGYFNFAKIGPGQFAGAAEIKGHNGGRAINFVCAMATAVQAGQPPTSDNPGAPNPPAPSTGGVR